MRRWKLIMKKKIKKYSQFNVTVGLSNWCILVLTVRHHHHHRHHYYERFWSWPSNMYIYTHDLLYLVIICVYCRVESDEYRRNYGRIVLVLCSPFLCFINIFFFRCFLLTSFFSCSPFSSLTHALTLFLSL